MYIVHLSQNLKRLGELLCHETYYIVKAQGLSPRHGHHQWWSLDRKRVGTIYHEMEVEWGQISILSALK